MHFLGKLSTTGMTNLSKHQNATLAKLMQSLLRTNTLQDECMMSNIMLLRISQHKLMNKKTKKNLDTIMSNNLPKPSYSLDTKKTSKSVRHKMGLCYLR